MAVQAVDTDWAVALSIAASAFTPQKRGGTATIPVTASATLSIKKAISGSLGVDVSTGSAALGKSASMAGSSAMDVAASGTLTTPYKYAEGSLGIDVAVEAAAMSATRYAEGSMDLDVAVGPGELANPVTELPVAGSTDVDLMTQGEIDLVFHAQVAGDFDLGIALSGALAVEDVTPELAGSTSADVGLGGTASRHAWLDGSISIPVTLVGGAFDEVPMPDATATITLVATPGTMGRMSIASFEPVEIAVQVHAFNRIRVGIGLPPLPEPAAPGQPAVAQGLVVRALHGVIVDMPNPVIVNGKPT